MSTGAKGSPRLAVLNLVGLCKRLLGEKHTPSQSISCDHGGNLQIIEPVTPAVTCSAQATYLTGKTPNEHGIVGNGWYDRTLNEHHFWKQSNRLVGMEKKFGKQHEKPDPISAVPIYFGGSTCTAVQTTPSPPARSTDPMG